MGIKVFDSTFVDRGGGSIMKQTVLSPISGKQRIEILDVIRGIALLGVLIAHIQFFNSLILSPENMIFAYDSLATQIYAWVLAILVNGRFFPIFSFLFGLGFYIFMNRAAAKGLKTSKLFVRRMVGLLIIGFLHFVFVWSGDILFTFAIAGFFLLIFRKKEPKIILKWIVIFLILTTIAMALIQSLNYLIISLVGEEEMSKILQATIDEMTITMSQGTYLEILSTRLINEVISIFFLSIPIAVISVLPLFLMGFYVGKMRYFERLDELLSSFKKMWRLSLIIGVFASLLFALLIITASESPSLFQSIAIMVVGYFSGIVVSTFYVTSAVLLFKKGKFKTIGKHFGYVGKMALTNYLMQSFICTFIFWGFGLGLFGQIEFVSGLFIALGIFTFQIFASKIWLHYYKYGPFEWVWRKFTYKNKLLLRSK